MELGGNFRLKAIELVEVQQVGFKRCCKLRWSELALGL